MATTYELEKRLSNLENLVDYLSKQITNIKEYADADTAGNRQSIGAITPTTLTKTAYIGDTEIAFDNVPYGNLTIYTDKPLNYSYTREDNRVTISFDELEEVITITLSIL